MTCSRALIEFSIANRLLVISATLLVAVGGAYSALHLPIDAIPDMTNVQVQVLTDAGSLSPVEVEKYVSYPIETAMAGLPGVERDPQRVKIRPLGRDDRVCRGDRHSMGSATRLAAVGDSRHENSRRVSARPNSDRWPPRSVKSCSSRCGAAAARPWISARCSNGRLLPSSAKCQESPRSTPTAVSTSRSRSGPNPDRLTSNRLSLEDVFRRVEENNETAGGGYVVHNGEQRFIRGIALLKGIEDIEGIVLRRETDSTPILVRDVASVAVAPLTRQGAVTRDGRGEVVIGMVMMLYGENSRQVVQRAKARLEEIERTLPEGVKLEVVYDRSSLIGRTLKTVLTNLTEGGLLVIVVLLAMLGSVRAGLLVTLAIPLSMLFATNLMAATGITASLMSLGAIDFGLIVDSSVIMVENCIRRLASPSDGRSRLEIIRDAAVEVRKPTMFGELIIAIVYVPILALQGTEGKLFKPMALTVLFALCGSLILVADVHAGAGDADVAAKLAGRGCLARAARQTIATSRSSVGCLRVPC